MAGSATAGGAGGAGATSGAGGASGGAAGGAGGAAGGTAGGAGGDAGGTAGSAGSGGCGPGSLLCQGACVDFAAGCDPPPTSFKIFFDSAPPNDGEERLGSSLVAADFNGDGVPDIAMSVGFNGLSEITANTYGLATWRGRGDGTFDPPVFLPTNTKIPSPDVVQLSSIVAADLDGDKRMDLIGNDQSLAFYPGVGDGTFAPKVVSVGPPTTEVVPGDFDGDSLLDVVATGDQFQFWHGAGKGIFVAGDSFPVGDHLTSTTAADVDGDGFLDILTTHNQLAGSSNSGSVQLLLGSGKGTFSASKSILDYPGATRTAVADLDENGIPDIVILSIAKKPDRIAVLLGKGKGEFAAPVFYQTQNHPTYLQLADLNGDQHLDMVLSTDHGPEIFLSRANGTFDNPSIFLPQEVGGYAFIAVADMNKDGKPDFVISESVSFTCYLNTSP